MTHDTRHSTSDDAFRQWRDALQTLTARQDDTREWRQRRYRFAHRLGQQLIAADSTGRPVTGPVLYGVWLRWGLLYIGQTLQAERRLRDLPVGESHHLASTFPPEIWDRVVVIRWPELPEAAALTHLRPDETGLALEHRLQSRLQPLVNSERRTPDGGWRAVLWARSRSRGARTAHRIDDLYDAVHRIWTQAARTTAGDQPDNPAFRVVRPETLLSEPVHHD
ncbi:hypothetical protein [Rugosimonospora africana]|uniref:hypothetical protein n=1 Tax=Rugosimonospora africana TaxID=556532 RepID=UPI001943B525|nr:hypothetical protein [Rugosimonospora africana]